MYGSHVHAVIPLPGTGPPDLSNTRPGTACSPAGHHTRRTDIALHCDRPPADAEPPSVPTPAASPIAIEYETFGDPSDPAVLLVMGFGTQLLGWDADFCRLLAARGRYVIRYDNRDCGLSTKLDEHPVHLADFITAVTSGDFDRALAMAPYSLRDMAARRDRLLDAARHRPRSRGGLLDGRHDRAEDGDRVPRSGAVVDLDDVVDRRAGVRPVHPRGAAGAVLPAASRPRRATSPRQSASSSGRRVATATRHSCVPWPRPATTAPTTRPVYRGSWPR